MTRSHSAIVVQREDDAGDAPDDGQLGQWADAALDATGGHGEVTVRIVGRSESRALNADYRDKDKPTNVLSFPFEAPEGLPADALPDILGDLVICAAVVAEEAAEQGKTLSAHWAHMVVHGILHLLGHDHIDDNDAEIMENLERQIMASLGFADPYQDQQE